jgi:parallel beta-helix repeat protein
MERQFYKGMKYRAKIKFIVLLWSIIFSLGSCSKGNAQSTLPHQEIWVNDVGANGSDTLNDTWAFQKAIDSMAGLGGGTVKVQTGNYYIDADSSIKIKSGVTLDMFDTTRNLIAIPTYSGRYNIISIKNVNDVTVNGGKITGERKKHLGPECAHKCEQGYGIAISGSKNIKIKGTIITECWGDGVVLYGSLGVDCKNITLMRVTSSNNRRQGLSILNGDSVMVDSCAFINTHGTPPQDGIDIEPDAGTTQNVTIQNCLLAYNTGNGVEMNAKTTTSAVIRNITVRNNFIHHNAYSAYVQHVSNCIFTNNRMIDNKYGDNRVHVSSATNSFFEPNTYQ